MPFQTRLSEGTSTLSWAWQITRSDGAVTHQIKPNRALDIEVDEAARLSVFIADDWFGGCNVPDPRQAGAVQDAADSGR